jgi:small neutral amino acid transporter SnatA (MarC family)
MEALSSSVASSASSVDPMFVDAGYMRTVVQDGNFTQVCSNAQNPFVAPCAHPATAGPQTLVWGQDAMAMVVAPVMGLEMVG